MSTTVAPIGSYTFNAPQQAPIGQAAAGGATAAPTYSADAYQAAAAPVGSTGMFSNGARVASWAGGALLLWRGVRSFLGDSPAVWMLGGLLAAGAFIGEKFYQGVTK